MPERMNLLTQTQLETIVSQLIFALQGVRVQNALLLCYIRSSNLQRKTKKGDIFYGLRVMLRG